MTSHLIDKIQELLLIGKINSHHFLIQPVAEIPLNNMQQDAGYGRQNFLHEEKL